MAGSPVTPAAIVPEWIGLKRRESPSEKREDSQHGPSTRIGAGRAPWVRENGVNVAEKVDRDGQVSGEAVTKPPYMTGRGRTKSGGSLGRMEHGLDEDRPFAEIRRNIHGVLRMLSLHRWAFFVPFSVVTCGAFILSLYYPRTYRATTSFERKNDPVMMNLPMSAGAASFKYFRNSMVRDLTSVDCMREVLEILELPKDIERDENGELTKTSVRRRTALARSLAGTLSVTTISPSEMIDVIRVTYTGPDPTIGTKLVDEVKRTYIRRTMVWIHDFLTTQRDYFESEAGDALIKVKKAQREETRLRLESPGVDPINPGTISFTLAQLEVERRELLLRQRAYTTEKSALEQLLAEAQPLLPIKTRVANTGKAIVHKMMASPRLLQLRAKVAEIDAKIKDLRQFRGMTDRHPEVESLAVRRRRLTDALAQLQAQGDDKTGANGPIEPILGDVAMETPGVIQPWQRDRARMLVQIAAQDTKIKDLDISIGSNKIAIDRVRQAKSQIYQKQEEFADIMGEVAKARQRHGQIEGTLASLEPAIKAVEQNRLLRFSPGLPARGSAKPISPKATTVVLLALLAGVATGVVFVVLAEVFDHIFRSSGQVARTLGLPLLEAIDEIVTAQDRRYLFVKNAVLTPLVVVCFVAFTSLTGSMAYLSIEQPWTYQKIRKIPQAALQLFAGAPEGTKQDQSATPH